MLKMRNEGLNEKKYLLARDIRCSERMKEMRQNETTSE